MELWNYEIMGLRDCGILHFTLYILHSLSVLRVACRMPSQESGGLGNYGIVELWNSGIEGLWDCGIAGLRDGRIAGLRD